MWQHRYRFVCACIALLISPFLFASLTAGDPSTQPLIQFADLSYLGAFRLPAQTLNNDSFSIGGHPIAFNPARNSLFVTSRAGRTAEIAIPAPVNSNDILQLPFATFLQSFYETTEGTIAQVSTVDASLSGLLVMSDRLYGSASIYYDAQNTQRVSHYSHSTTLSQVGVIGMRQVWEDAKSGFVSGYMAVVPAEWQALLGGPAVTGQCCIPVTWRTSWGPSAFAFNPADINSLAKVPAAPLLYYPQDHPTLGHWNDSNPVYGGTTQVTGVALLAGTRTALFFGRNGTGTPCYGNGTSDQTLVGKTGPDGALWCFDPTSTAKGQHAYPYTYQIWAYDLNDFAAVKAGVKRPWDVRPYGVWPFGFPFPETQVELGGTAYDASRQILYVSQLFADKDGYGYRPIIHALKVGGGATGAPLPPFDPTALPPVTDSTPVNPTITALSLTANKTAPQPAGTTIRFTATPTGGYGPHQYKWLTHDGYNWTFATGWSTSSTFDWTPAAANASDRIGVWVRSATNTADQAEMTSSMDFAIIGGSTGTTSPAPTPGATSGGRLTAVTLSANKPAPQPAGTLITFAATPTGGTAPQQYKWLMHDGLVWKVVADWSTNSAFNWTPASANTSTRFGVWVRSAGNTVDAGEVTASMDYPITAGTSSSTTTPPPTTTPTAKLSAVTISTSKPAPQPANTTITFTATPNGGAAPQQYKWLVHNGAQWSAIGDWSTANTFNWTPTAANTAYRFGVWVRSAGNTVDAGEATASIDYPISAATTSTTPPPTSTTTTSSRLLAVSMTANKVAPQPANTTITFTATPNGGATPQQYKWLVHNGVQWSAIGEWSTASTFNWTPTAANTAYRFGVWVRSAGNSADAGEVTASMDYPISAATSSQPPPPTTTTTTSSRLLAVSMTANKVAPQPANTTITFTATPNGGAAPQQYKWLVHNGTQWSVIGDWSTSNTFNWTPTVANAAYRFGVWVRSAGNTADAAEVTSSMDFAIGAATSAPSTGTTTTTTSKLLSVTLGADKIAPQPQNSTITFTAIPNGGATPQQFKWLMHDGVQWKVIGDWTTSNVFKWTPVAWNPSARVGVWVRSAGNTTDVGEVTASMDYPISAATTTAAPSTATAIPLSAVSIVAGKVAPQPAGTTTTFTAVPVGGAAPQQFKWLVHNGAQWTAVTDWTTTASYNWTPAVANPSYRIGVWVRSAGNTVDAPQVSASIDFAIK